MGEEDIWRKQAGTATGPSSAEAWTRLCLTFSYSNLVISFPQWYIICPISKQTKLKPNQTKPNQTKLNSVQVKLNLPTGTELGKNKCSTFIKDNKYLFATKFENTKIVLN